MTTSAFAVPDLTGTWTFTGTLASSPNGTCPDVGVACLGGPVTFVARVQITQHRDLLTAQGLGDSPLLTGSFIPPLAGPLEFRLGSGVYTMADVPLCRAVYQLVGVITSPGQPIGMEVGFAYACVDWSECCLWTGLLTR